MQKIKKILRAVFEKNDDRQNNLSGQELTTPAGTQLTLRINYYCSDSMGPAPTESQVQNRKKSCSDSARRVADKEDERTTSESESSSSGEDNVCRRLAAAGVSSAQFISHVRRTRRNSNRGSKAPRYQVQVIVKERGKHVC